MDAHDERDDLTDDDEVTAHRARAKDLLNEIARQAKRALHDAGIDLDLFFMIPNSGDAIITYGTPGDPPDDEWNRVREVVSSVVRQAVGLDRVRCREVVCATTDSVGDHQPIQSSLQPIEPSGCRSTPSPTPALQNAGADR